MGCAWFARGCTWLEEGGRRGPRAGFSQRRKTLENALSTRFPKPLVRQILADTVGSGRRAEELDLEAWGLLARALELALASG